MNGAVETGGCNGGIYDLQGNVWAASEGFGLQTNEVQALSSWLHCGEVALCANVGAMVAGEKYMYVQGDDEDKWVYLKKQQKGIIFIACNTCIVVLQHDEKTQRGTSQTTALKLADTLKGNDY